jgi:two-component system response regulator AtoC
VSAIHLPSLRDRSDDILPLSEALLVEIGKGMGRPPSGISRDARNLLTDYRWPGNVRELRNVLERAAILCQGGLITAEHLTLNVATRLAPSFVVDVAAAGAGLSSSSAGGGLQPMERVMIEQALQSARFNKSKAAKVLGLTRQQLYVRLRKYGLD